MLGGLKARNVTAQAEASQRAQAWVIKGEKEKRPVRPNPIPLTPFQGFAFFYSETWGFTPGFNMPGFQP